MTTIGKITELGDSLINAALDRLEDELESRLDATGFAGTNPSSIGDVALSSDAIASAKACAKWWTELALAEKREDWTSAAMEMASAKEDGEARAKALGVVAKAAKKDASDPSAASQRALIKAMGDEVNATRTRCEFAETAFMSTLNDLDDAPDPAESLTKSLAAAEALGALASEAATLRRELDAANRSLASAAADAAVAARERAELEALRESREREVDAAVATRVADAEKTVAELEVKLEAAAVAREKAEAALRETARRHDDAQGRLFELEEARERGRDVDEREDASLVEEVERMRQETARLRQELNARGARGSDGAIPAWAAAAGMGAGAGSGSGDAGGDGASVAALKEKLAVSNRVADQLKTAIEETERALELANARAVDQAVDAARELANANATIADLERRLREAPSRASVAASEAKIATLRALVDAEDAADDDVEQLTPLLAVQRRNRRLSDELAASRRETSAAKRELRDATRRAADATAELRRREQTIDELEQHLVRVGGGGEGADGDKTAKHGAVLDPDLLPVVAGQRDRLKRRVEDLELQTGALEADLEASRASEAKLKSDNVSLFEKVRYLQSYYAEKGAGANGGGRGGQTIVRVDAAGVPARGGVLGELMQRRAARYGCIPGGGVGGGARGGGVGLDALPGGDDGGVVARYDEAYRLSINPYEKFRASEESAGLGPGGRVARSVLRTRASRTMFALYFLLLHATVFWCVAARGSGAVAGRAAR